MFIGIWLTTACNLRCKYCYEGQEKPQIMMTKDVAEQCINYIKDRDDPLLIVQFHGGEPLLNYDVLKFIIASIQKNKKVNQKIMYGITTNATLLDDEKVKFLSEYMDYGLSISLDGNKDVNDLMRIYPDGKGTYDSVISKIKRAIALNSNIRFRMTFTSQTVSDLCKSIFHLIELGAKQIVSIPDYFDKGWTEDTLKTYRNQLYEIEKMYKQNYVSTQDIEIALLENNVFQKTKCTGGYNSIQISPVGELYPCTYVVGKPEYKIGDLKSGIEIEVLESISQINEEPMEVCVGCNNYLNCNSVRCKYLNKLLTGNCLSPSPVICAFEHVNVNFSKR